MTYLHAGTWKALHLPVSKTKWCEHDWTLRKLNTPVTVTLGVGSPGFLAVLAQQSPRSHTWVIGVIGHRQPLPRVRVPFST